MCEILLCQFYQLQANSNKGNEPFYWENMLISWHLKTGLWKKLSLIFIVSEKCHHIHDTYARDGKPRGWLPAAWWGHHQTASPFLQHLKDSAGGRQGPVGQVMQRTAWWARGLVRRDRDPLWARGPSGGTGTPWSQAQAPTQYWGPWMQPGYSLYL